MCHHKSGITHNKLTKSVSATGTDEPLPSCSTAGADLSAGCVVVQQDPCQCSGAGTSVSPYTCPSKMIEAFIKIPIPNLNIEAPDPSDPEFDYNKWLIHAKAEEEMIVPIYRDAWCSCETPSYYSCHTSWRYMA